MFATATPKQQHALHRGIESVLRQLRQPARVETLESRLLLTAGPSHWPAGPELTVAGSAYGTGAVAMDSDGDFVLAWNHVEYGYYGTYSDIRARRYNAAGAPQGAELQLTSLSIFDYNGPPAVAMDADGDFVVAWQSYQDVFAQRYNAAGVAQGAAFLVNTFTTNSQHNPSAAMDADGDFVIAWQSYGQDGSGHGIFAQRYTAAGAKQGTEFRVNTSTSLNQVTPTVARDADGDFVVAWGSGDGITPYDVYAQRYNSAGVAQGTEFRANSYTTDHQLDPSAAIDANGNFVVTWSSEGQDGSNGGIYARRYSPVGVPRAAEFRVNTETVGTQNSPSAAMNASGEVIIAWAGSGIRAQRYDAAGAPLGTEFRVNAEVGAGPGAAMEADGDFVIAGQSPGAVLRAQRYTTFGPTSAAVIGDRVWDDANANGIQDPGESGIAGAAVELSLADGTGVASLTTSATGHYSFSILADASVFLHFLTPAGFLPTYQNQGANDELDSDADRATGRTPNFTGAAGTTNTSVDAGFCLPASISGNSFNDRNGDGIRNGAEEGMAGFQVFLDLDTDGVLDLNEPATNTDTAGNFAFANLLSDTYRIVVVDQDLWIEPSISPLLAVPGSSNQINLALRTTAPDRSSQPMGPEFRANSTTTGHQASSSIAMDDAGNFVVAWSGSGSGDDSGIFAQRYNAAGSKQGAEFRVNSFTTSTQSAPSAAMDVDGDFVVTWESYQDGSGNGVYAQRYNALGVKQGIEFRVNTSTAGEQGAPAAAMDAAGNFVVSWSGSGSDDDVGIFAQRFNAAGATQGAEFRVNTSTASNEVTPTVAMDAEGDFVVAWSSGYSGYYTYLPYNVYAQRYAASGVAQGTESFVGVGASPSAAMDADGDFVVAWQSYGISARRYNSSGVAQGTESFVGDGSLPSAAMDADGDFVVTWHSADIFSQRYNAAGVKQAGQFRVNSYTTNNQFSSAAAMDADGDFVVTWQSYGQDGNGYGIFAQRYTAYGAASEATAGDRVWNDANGNGIQDSAEPEIAGAIVELYNSDGVFVGSKTTDATGHYTFAALAGSSVYLRFITPAGIIPTRANQGANDNLDSDADRTTGLSSTFTIGTAGTSNSSIDAGFCVPSSISGMVFNDRNGNGVRDGGEEGVPGFEVYLDLDGDGLLDAGEPALGTNVNGTYRFDNLLEGTYPLVVSGQDLWVEPASSSFVLPTGTAGILDLPVRTSAHDTASLPQGNEFGVNSETSFNQMDSSVAMDAAGNFVVTWESAGQDGSSYGIYAQRYNAAGVRQGGEFRVNKYTSGSQFAPSVAMDTDGDFVITWQSYGQDGSGNGIYAQRFNAAGMKQGQPFRVNTVTANGQERPSVAMDSAGDFVIAWQSYLQDGSGFGVYAQRYNAAGSTQGTEFRVNPYTTGNQLLPTAVMEANGDFIVAWTGSGASGSGVYLQRYNASGAVQGSEFRVNSSPSNTQFRASVALDADGDFVVVWPGFSDEGYSGFAVRAQRFNNAGVKRGTEFRVSTSTTISQGVASAAMDSDGDFVITWESYGQDGSQGGIHAQRYNAAGLPQGAEFQVNSFTSNWQSAPVTAMAAGGNFVVSWSSAFQDGSENGIFAQRYAVSQRPAITASQFVWQNAPQRIEFTFDQDVSSSLSTADLVLVNLTTGTTIPSGSIVMSWNAATRTSTVRFPSLPNGGSLPDGNYRATLAAAGIRNAAGTSIAVDYALDFFVLAGDANRDRVINISDFSVLAARFNLAGTFSQGDFNYNGTTEIGDFAILASKFNTSLPAPSEAERAAAQWFAALALAAPPSANPLSAPTTFGRLRIDRDELASLLSI